MLSDKHKKVIIKTLGPYNPSMVAIFGSYARHENNAESDLDILVDFENTVNLLDIIGIEQELSNLLGIKVDLVTKQSLHPQISTFINKDMQRII